MFGVPKGRRRWTISCAYPGSIPASPEGGELVGPVADLRQERLDAVCGLQAPPKLREEPEPVERERVFQPLKLRPFRVALFCSRNAMFCHVPHTQVLEVIDSACPCAGFVISGSVSGLPICC